MLFAAMRCVTDSPRSVPATADTAWLSFAHVPYDVPPPTFHAANRNVGHRRRSGPASAVAIVEVKGNRLY
jgi:hypothetical protein